MRNDRPVCPRAEVPKAATVCSLPVPATRDSIWLFIAVATGSTTTLGPSAYAAAASAIGIPAKATRSGHFSVLTTAPATCSTGLTATYCLKKGFGTGMASNAVVLAAAYLDIRLIRSALRAVTSCTSGYGSEGSADGSVVFPVTDATATASSTVSGSTGGTAEPMDATPLTAAILLSLTAISRVMCSATRGARAVISTGSTVTLRTSTHQE